MHLSPAELEARLRLHALPNIGPARFHKLLRTFGSASAAMSAPASAWHALGMPAASTEQRRSEATRREVNQTLRWLEQPEHQVLFTDLHYPALLLEIADPPPVLFIKGQTDVLELPQIALVGSRQASITGLDNARHFAKCLAQAGFVVTSGLALGIDGAAHLGALETGKTIAVVGTGLLHTYPKSHTKLAQNIVSAGGALVSELPLHSSPQAAHFPRRNRIISGLSLGVLVVEASLKSGSLITARLALEQGREVYAIPGSIHHPGARGCHQLIKDGAQLVEHVSDILEPLKGWQQPYDDSPKAQASELLAALLSAPLSAESLAHALSIPLPKVLAELTELELAGHAHCQGGVWYGRAP